MKYQIILADPPWNFNFQKRAGLSDEAKAALYPTMKSQDIIDLPVAGIADDNCILFLWIMNSELPLALECIKNWGFCCVPETKILRADLTWKKAGDLIVGEKLLGFDEHCTKNERRYYKWSTVEATGRINLPCYKITLDNGDQITCSEDHEWLCRYRQPCGQTGIFRWCKTKNLLNDYNGRTLSTVEIIKLADIKEHIKSFESGFISGSFDSEGSLNSIRPRICFAQKDNALLKRVCEYLDEFGYKYKKHFFIENLCHLDMHGGIIGVMNFLQQFRPPRLMENWEKLKFFKNSVYNSVAQKVISVEYVGVKEVVSLQTSSRTYIAEGYASHNTYKSVAFTWVKTRKKAYHFGGGNWTRSNPELCLLATKGKIKRKSASVRNLIVSPLREHSRKPDCVRDMIAELVGDLPRIELFARQTAPGWHSIGNDINGRDIREELIEIAKEN